MRNAIEARLFNSYRNFRQSCYNPNNPVYRAHAQAGIYLECKFNSFKEFRDWVLETLGPPPNDHARLIRKKMTGHYTKTNLEWGTFEEQQNRQRSCHFVKYQGRSQTLIQWIKELGLSKDIIYPKYRKGITDPKILFRKKT